VPIQPKVNIVKKSGFLVAVVAGVLLASQGSLHAQSATVIGSLGNFDVANNQQQEAHGFEIELEGIHPEDISSTFETERYGAPTLVSTDTGVIVRWASAYSPVTGFAATTAAHSLDAPLAGACYQWAGPAYDASGCEHFGVTLLASATKATYRWLVANPEAIGSLLPGAFPIAVATPSYWVTPPTTGAPLLNADVDAPPATYPTSYGDAFWVKIFRRPMTREVSLGELTNDNPAVVPEDNSSLEASWVLIQADPQIQFTNGGGGTQRQSRGRTRSSGPLSGDTRAVVRRYEIYTYTGLYDPFFHQAVCADLTCTAPSAGELGELMSAQMTAANVVVPSVTVTRSGSGTVTSKDGRINCGSACSALYPSGATTTLIASNGGGVKFTGWTGACSGTSSNCTVLVDAHLNVGATFSASTTTTTPTTTTSPTTTPTATKTSLVTLSVGLSNKGTVTSDNGAINCPNGTCSAKFPVGTTVTLTAVPTAGAFQSWTDACTGTGSTCTFTISKDSKVQATFSK
jgi:Divergent InlB B-repeat domain